MNVVTTSGLVVTLWVTSSSDFNPDSDKVSEQT